MKKTIISIAAVFGVILILVMVVFTMSSNHEQIFTQKKYEKEGTEIKDIIIDVKDRQIEVSQSKDNQIHVLYSESDKEYYNISVSDDHVFTMTLVNNKKWTDYIGKNADMDHRKIDLQVPNALLNSLKISTTNENIQLSNLSVKTDITLSSNKGNISFDKMNAGNNIYLNGKDGNITGSIVGSYDDYAIVCKIKKGECNLPAEKKKGLKKLSIKANNGEVKINFDK